MLRWFNIQLLCCLSVMHGTECLW